MSNLIGSKPDQVSTNNMLGGMAFEDPGNYAASVGGRDIYANGSSGASRTITWATGVWQSLTLSADCTVVFDFAGCPSGRYRLTVIQDATGQRAITWSTNTPGSTKWLSIVGSPSLKKIAAGLTIIDLYWDKNNCYGAAHHVDGAAQALVLERELIPAGQTGAKTINKPAGRVNFAAGASSLVVTNSMVTADSIVIPVVCDVDATLKTVVAVSSSGSFNLNGNAAATAETRVGFIVLNGIDYD